MAAEKGNKYWTFAKNIGLNKMFSSPQELWDAAVGYFEWADANPWVKNEAAKAGDHFGELVHIPTQRPYTQEALCIHLGCNVSTFQKYCNSESHKEYWDVAHLIRNIIRTQKFEGAAVGIFNPMIISRDLGLAEKSEHTGKDGGPIEVTDPKNDSEIARKIAFLLTKAVEESEKDANE